MRLYIYNEKIKLISNQLGSSYRYLGINSDGSAWFLICTSLISQHFGSAIVELLNCSFTVLYLISWPLVYASESSKV